jgi:excisionase family DNA binding protein
MKLSQTSEYGQPWADPQEAAEILGVTVRTVYTYCREGTLPARKVGGLWRIDRSALEPEPQPA